MTTMVLSRMVASGSRPLWLRAAARRTAVFVPKVGTEAEMQAQAIQQLRARVQYQKELMKNQHEHGSHDDVAEMWRWVSISLWIGLPICGLSLFYTTFFDEHHHRHDGPLPDYMGIRNKEYPWECSECDLFDSACWKKCRAEKVK